MNLFSSSETMNQDMVVVSSEMNQDMNLSSEIVLGELSELSEEEEREVVGGFTIYAGGAAGGASGMGAGFGNTIYAGGAAGGASGMGAGFEVGSVPGGGGGVFSVGLKYNF